MPETTTTRLTKVRVLKDVPCDDTYTDVRYFEDTGSQQGFFEGFVKHTYENAAYQRVNDQVAPYRELLTLRIPAVADDVYDCNYIMFQNQPYGNKWFYAFIRKVNFVSPNCTKIDYEIDWFQTYMCDFEVHPCMVLREHVNPGDDIPFANTVPEPFQVTKYTVDIGATDDYVIGGSSLTGSYCTVAAIPNKISLPILEGAGAVGDALYSGIYNGAMYISFPALTAPAAVKALIAALAAVDAAECICGIFMTPVPPIQGTDAQKTSWTSGINVNGETMHTVGGTYNVHNKKLLSYPFCYIEGTSDSGDEAIYKPELVGGNAFGGTIYTMATNTFGLKFVPDYMGEDALPENSLNYFAVVNCTWRGQSYDQASTANAVRQLNYLAHSTINTALNEGLGNNLIPNPIGAVFGAIRGINEASSANDMANVNGQFELPVQHFNSSGPDTLNYTSGYRGFHFRRYCPNYEDLERLDTLFDLFGYQVNKCKMPNLTGRPKWNYVQLQKPCITGSVPVQGMMAIKAAFARGVRLWHVDEIGEYNGPGDNG